jgi:hypothetical protein
MSVQYSPHMNSYLHMNSSVRPGPHSRSGPQPAEQPEGAVVVPTRHRCRRRAAAQRAISVAMSLLSRRHPSHPCRPSPVTPSSSTSCIAPSRSASQRVSGPTLKQAEQGERRCPSSATAAGERATRANASAPARPRRKLSKAIAATPPLPPPLASAAAHPSPPPWAASAQREPTRQRPDPDASCRHRCR